MDDSLLTDPVEMGKIVETAVYKHVAAFYYQQAASVGQGWQISFQHFVLYVLPHNLLGHDVIIGQGQFRETAYLIRYAA